MADQPANKVNVAIDTMTVCERQKLKTKIQPTSQNQRENDMMTTGNAAAPQPRFASINKMTHLKAAADRIQELRDGLTFDGQEQCDEFSTKDEDIEYDFLVPKQQNLVGKQE